MPAILFYWICENHNELEYRKFANYGFTLASFFSGAGTLFSGIGTGVKTITYVKTFADLIDVSLMYGFEDYLRKNTDKYGNAALDLYSLISIGLTVHDPIEELFKESIKPSTAIFTAWESFKTTNTYNAMILEDENTVIKFDAMMKLLKDVK